MRKKLFLMNSVCSIAKQMVVAICGLILPRWLLVYYGSGVNGLISSVTHFLSFITFLEMGVGSVVASNLYKPLADKNHDEISKIVVSSERFFKKIAAIFLVYIVGLAIFFPLVVEDQFSYLYTCSLIVIIAVSIFAQNYLGITYQILLNADQKGYIPILLQILTIILNTTFSIVLMKLGASIHIVKLVASSLYLVSPIFQILYVHHTYHINTKIQFQGEPIKQKWNGFAQHLAATVVANTDVTVLSLCSSLQNVSIYSIYFNVVYGITNIVASLTNGLESLWGNMLAKQEMEKLTNSFEVVEWIMHAGSTWLFTVTEILLVPFIQIYTAEIVDANYIVPVFGATLAMSYAVCSLRLPYFAIIGASGKYKETQNGSFIQMIINLSLSVALVFKFELNGVAVGTLVAMLYHTTYFAWFLRKNILSRPFIVYLKYLLTDIVIAITCIIATSGIALATLSYLSWVVMAVKVSIICALICVLMNLIFYRNMFGRLAKFIGKR